jgi:uncharacterized protein (TIGR00266 family)
MADELEYTILGDDMQLVELTLAPGGTVIAEAGGMSYMDEGITYESVLGDGSRPAGDLLSQAFGAGKRILSGESLFLTHFTNGSEGRRTIAFAAPYPGKIIPIELGNLGGEFFCQKSSYLCSARGIQLDIAFTRNFAAGLLGGEGFILERLRGRGTAFIHAGGTVVRKELTGGTLLVDTGCLVGFTSGINYDIAQAGGLKSMLFGGEGLFLASLSGTGIVYVQSLPFSRLARRVLQQLPLRPGSKDEGSILGALGGFILGDRR